MSFRDWLKSDTQDPWGAETRQVRFFELRNGQRVRGERVTRPGYAEPEERYYKIGGPADAENTD